MTEEMVVVLTITLILSIAFGLGCLALAARVIERQARVTSMILAQSDEHLKIGLTFGEKATSRLMAAKMPESHRNFRGAAGPVVDGAQHQTKDHFTTPFPEIESMAARQAASEVAKEAAIATAQARAVAMPPEQLDVNTALEFERNGMPTT